MAKSPIFHGSKAKVFIDNQLIGIFTSCTWSAAYDVHTAHILGRHGVAQFTYTGMDAVRVNLTGFRVLNTGPYAIGTIPELKALMEYQGISIEVLDREDETKIVARFQDFYGTDFSTGVNARSISDVSVSGLAATISDETSDGSEGKNETSITDGNL